MLKAKLFKDGKEIIVCAQDIKDGLFSRNNDFVDIRDEFRVVYVSAAKNHGAPYFRLYLSLEDYRKLSPEQKQKYDILRPMRHWRNGPWHNEWERKLSSFCELEKRIEDVNSGKWKFSDAYYAEKKECIELQHSYIDSDFENRNEFYFRQGISVIWLYDLTESEIRKTGEWLEILENNSKGFFRVAEKQENLKSNPVFIQMKNKSIYWVDELHRKEINNEEGLKSTIRYFAPKGVFTVDEFINGLKQGDFISRLDTEKVDTIYNLWREAKPSNYAIFQNVRTGYYIGISMDPAEQKVLRGYISNDINGLFGKGKLLSEIYYPNEPCYKLIYKK